jgi:hypothetical protein
MSAEGGDAAGEVPAHEGSDELEGVEGDTGTDQTPSTDGKRKRGRGRPKSWVHEHVKDDGTHSRCQLMVRTRMDDGTFGTAPCGRRFKNTGSTSGMLNHLVHDHGFDKDGTKKARQTQIAVGPTGGLTAEASGAPVLPWTVLDPRSKRLTFDIARMVALDGVPAEFVAHTGFSAFMQHHFPRYPLATPPTIRGRVEELAIGMRDWISSYMPKVPYVALTTDGWQSEATDHYRTVTAHFFDGDSWNMRVLVLVTDICGGKAFDIASFIDRAVAESKLTVQQVVCITTDTANAEKAGAREAELCRINCMCHVLHLTMQLVTKKPKVATATKAAKPGSPVLPALTKMLDFAKKLHVSPILKETFVRLGVEYCRAHQLPPLCVPTTTVVTRWGSVAQAIAVCMPARAVIDKCIAMHKEYNLTELSADDWTVIEQTGTTLSAFRQLSAWLEAEEYPTAPEALGRLLAACFTCFYQCFAKEEEFHPLVRQLRAEIRNDIGTRLYEGENDITLAGIALHPMWKNIAVPGGIPQHLFAENNGKNVLSFFFRDFKPRMKDAVLRLMTRFDIKDDAPPARGPEEDGVLNFIIYGRRRAEAGVSVPTEEVDRWFKEPPDALGRSATAFWEVHATSFPLLRRLARIVLVAQASSAASERIWSAAGLMSSGNRASVSASTLGNQLLLKKNAPTRAIIEGKDAWDVLGQYTD